MNPQQPYRPGTMGLRGALANRSMCTSTDRPSGGGAWKRGCCFALGVALILWGFYPPAGWANPLEKRIGAHDAILVANPEGKALLSKNAGSLLIPASTLKIFTALFALDSLGAGFRFETEFYLDERENLKIKGYGDPLLISEVVREIAAGLRAHITAYNDLVLDDSYFDQPIDIPGISPSLQPYDAPNGALCVNFNTINFHREKSGRYVSAEPQTPLLDFAMDKVKASGLKKGRIIFSQHRKEITLYAGHLFRHFLTEAGIASRGRLRSGRVDKDGDRLILRYRSPFSLGQVITRLMAYSNNFTANQILIAAGAKIFGAPGNLEKGVRAAKAYAASRLRIDPVDVVEGSGISRKNRISANAMLTVLNAFKAHHLLMRHEGNFFFKTGSLYGISARAGYVERSSGTLYPFVVFLNTKGKSAESLMEGIEAVVRKH